MRFTNDCICHKYTGNKIRAEFLLKTKTGNQSTDSRFTDLPFMKKLMLVDLFSNRIICCLNDQLVRSGLKSGTINTDQISC